MADTRTFVLLLVAALAAVGACGDPPTTGRPPSRTAQVTGATLIAGGEGTLAGVNLDLLPSTVTVDGQAVTLTSQTETEVRFRMPTPRPCEVDARQVAISAGTVSYDGRLSVPSVVRMEPGESRLLSRNELAAACLQFPGGDQSFVVTALNPSLREGDGALALFTARSWTGPGGDAAAAAGRTTSAAPSRGPQLQITRGDDAYEPDPVEFDARYATAAPGDTVTWVDFRSPDWYADGTICEQPKARVPTFAAVVAAQSSTGRTVIAFDARTQHGAVWSSADTRARLTRLADIVERWTLPAMREVFDPAYEPVRGADGRWWHIFRTGVSVPTVDQAGLPQSMCSHFSEVATTLGPDVPPTFDAQVEVLAGYLIHEYAHHAEDVIAVRAWGNVFGRGTPGWGGIGESWAQTVSETAARLASGQPTAARYDRLTPGSGIPYADFYGTGYGERPDMSPWGGGRGAYDHGTRLLMFLREQWGDATPGSARERFYHVALRQPSYDFASLAALVGLEPTTALDRWSLAEATDDLVAPEVALARGLPQIRSWVPQDREPPSRVSRSVNGTHHVVVAPGSYAALYFLPAGGQGVSVTFSGITTAPFVARVTRLR